MNPSVLQLEPVMLLGYAYTGWWWCGTFGMLRQPPGLCRVHQGATLCTGLAGLWLAACMFVLLLVPPELAAEQSFRAWQDMWACLPLEIGVAAPMWEVLHSLYPLDWRLHSSLGLRCVDICTAWMGSVGVQGTASDPAG